VIDGAGTVMLWDAGAERLSGCARERAIGGLLFAIMPSLRDTPLPRAIADTLQDRAARSVGSVSVVSGSATRSIDLRVIPADAGAALLWTDVTDRTSAERELKRTVERLMLAADGASDALWEWDLRTKDFYVSARWKAMLGLEASVEMNRVEDWLGRVHPDDAAALNSAMKAHLGGETQHLDHAHRVRHQDGSYRWVRC
jgi:PAS domain S-box-containing protein